MDCFTAFAMTSFFPGLRFGVRVWLDFTLKTGDHRA
jgi:hypothetical protein